MKNTLILLLIIAFTNAGYSQKRQYIGLNENTSDLNVLDSTTKNYNVFFVGENHSYRYTNSILEFKMLKYLNKKEGVNILLLEFGSATSWLVNKYLKTGNEKILNKIETTMHGSFRDLFKKIYNYNQTIDTNKITVKGIDIEFNYNIAIDVLAELIPTETIPNDSISQTLEVIEFIQGYIENNNPFGDYFFEMTQKYSKVATLKKIISNFENNKREYKKLIGKNYENFSSCIYSLKKSIEWKKEFKNRTPYAEILREKYIYNQFIELWKLNKNEKFFGQFGRAHTTKQKERNWSGFYNFSSVASRINNNKKFKVLSIGIYYPQYYKSHKYDYTEINGFQEIELVKNKFDDIPLDSILIYPLTKKDPYLKKKFDYLFLVNSNVKNDNQLKAGGNKSKIIDFEEYSGMDYSLGFQNINLQSYNDFFFDSTFKFNSQLTTHQINYYFYENFGPYVSLNFLWYNKNKVNLNDTTRLTLGGYKVNMNWGVDIIKNKHVDLIPQLGLGFNRLKTTIKEKQSHSSKYFNTETFLTEKITNPAFVIDLKADLKVTLFKFLSLGVTGGYQFDVSAKNWKYQKAKINNLKTSSNGYFLMLSIGFTTIY